MTYFKYFTCVKVIWLLTSSMQVVKTEDVSLFYEKITTVVKPVTPAISPSIVTTPKIYVEKSVTPELSSTFVPVAKIYEKMSASPKASPTAVPEPKIVVEESATPELSSTSVPEPEIDGEKPTTPELSPTSISKLKIDTEKSATPETSPATISELEIDGKKSAAPKLSPTTVSEPKIDGKKSPTETMPIILVDEKISTTPETSPAPILKPKIDGEKSEGSTMRETSETNVITLILDDDKSVTSPLLPDGTLTDREYNSTDSEKISNETKLTSDLKINSSDELFKLMLNSHETYMSPDEYEYASNEILDLSRERSTESRTDKEKSLSPKVSLTTVTDPNVDGKKSLPLLTVTITPIISEYNSTEISKISDDSKSRPDFIAKSTDESKLSNKNKRTSHDMLNSGATYSDKYVTTTATTTTTIVKRTGTPDWKISTPTAKPRAHSAPVEVIICMIIVPLIVSVSIIIYTYLSCRKQGSYTVNDSDEDYCEEAKEIESKV